MLEAADDLLAEKGFTGTTMEGIAARAGVAKQTIYRWWKTKTDVLMDAFLQDVAEELTPVDHGDIAVDLHTYLHQLARLLSHSDPGAVFKALIAQAQHDPVFAADFRTRFLDQQHRRDRLPLPGTRCAARAATRRSGPSRRDRPARRPHLHRVLVTGEPLDPAFLDRLVDTFLNRAAEPRVTPEHGRSAR